MVELTQNIADRICTAVVLGYSIDHYDKKTKKKVKFEYEDEGKSGDYKKVQEMFLKKGVEIDIAKSIEKKTLPCIAATANCVWNADMLATIGTFEKSVSDRLESLIAQQGIKGLYGAYIGGLSTIAKLRLVGGSDLELYEGKYRKKNKLTDSEITTISESYNKAKIASETINKFLHENEGKIKDVIMDSHILKYPMYEKGMLFKSYHGMIKAMVYYKSNFDEQNFFIEIAAGKETNKVSSCFPCTTYMTSVGKPPTSIHLGRGDNWNIPNGAARSDYDKWRNNISHWFMTGSKMMAQLDKLDININEIPDIFLEALTFESSFTDKIKVLG